MNQFTLREMMLQGWPVLSILLATSVLSITILVERYLVLRKARLNTARFIANVLDVIQTKGNEAALAYCRQFSQPMSVVTQTILKAPGDREAKERHAQNAIQTQIIELEKYVAVLGTIGSIAPFIGLFGTVIGIVRAFISMAVQSGGGIEVVAAGIAEALITTAVGLFVAIPAVVGYNYCVNRIRRLAEEMDVASFHVIEQSLRRSSP